MRGVNREPPWLVSAFFTLLFCAMATSALGLSESARIMPLVVSVPGALLSLLQLYRDLDSTVENVDVTSERVYARPAAMVAAVACLILLVVLFGLIVGCGVFIAGFFVFRAGLQVRYALLAAAAFCAFQYGVFTLLLGIQLYRGFMAP